MNIQSTTLVQPEDLANKVKALMDRLLFWKTHIDNAMSRIDNMYSFDDVVKSILLGQRAFYEYDNCFVIMQLETYPGYKTYHCFLAGGSTDAFIKAEPEIMAMAKSLGCKYITITGRVGWPRMLKRKEHLTTGWKHKLSVLHKEVV